MDATAIEKAETQILQQMGLKIGEIISLKSYCKGKDKKRSLLELIKAKRSGKTKKSTDTKTQNFRRSRKLQVGWQNHNFEQKRYVQVRLINGGGTRKLDVNQNAGMQELLSEVVSTFFPNGECNFGRKEDFELKLGNYKGDEIGETFENNDGISQQFTLQSYIDHTKLQQPRFYLLSKFISDNESSHSEDAKSSSESLSDGDDLHPAFSSTPGTSGLGAKIETQVIESTSEIINVDMMSPTVSDDECNEGNNDSALSINDSTFSEYINPSNLIGTSEERQLLVSEQDKDYMESLLNDLKKEEEKNRKSRLRQERQLRVPPEPPIHNEHVVVNVKHVTLGQCVRFFPADGTVSMVYDWIGSLLDDPENFTLNVVSNELVDPSDPISSVNKTTLYMAITEYPVLLSPQGQVSVRGFGHYISDDVNSIEDMYGTSIPADLPSVVDTSTPAVIPLTPVPVIVPECPSVDQSYAEVIEKGAKAREGCRSSGTFMVDRQNIVKDMLSVYKSNCNDSLGQYPDLQFRGETGIGSGAEDDVFRAFWDMFFTTYGDGNAERVPLVTADMTAEDFQAMGKIITHMFIKFKGFPIQFSHASMCFALFEAVTDKCLLDSFSNFLARAEREVVESAFSGVLDVSTLVDILSDYSTHTMPTSTNIRQLLVATAEMALINKPMFCLQNIRKGMGSFWNNVSVSELDALYSIYTPTASKVLEQVIFPETTVLSDSKVIRWLERFIQSSDEKMVRRFVEFTTGSPIVMPDRKISVRLVNQPEIALRPVAQTCFNIFKIARQYRSFAHMKENLDLYLSNPHLWEVND